MRTRRLLLSCAVALAATPSCKRSESSATATPPPPRRMAKRPPVIDVHTHLDAGNVPMAIQLMADRGLERIVNLSGGHHDNGKLSLWWSMSREFGDRIVHCYNVPWRPVLEHGASRAVYGLRDAVGMGYRCLKISKALGLGIPETLEGRALLRVDDERLDPLWAEAGKLGVPVFIHTADPRAFFEPATPDNERFEELSLHPDWSFADRKRYPTRDALLAARDRVVGRHPGTTFIGVHFANNPEDLDYVARTLAAHDNFYVDIAARLGELGRHDARRIRELFLRFQDRILFGTDIGVGRQLSLGSPGKEPHAYGDVAPFYEAHYRFLESDEASMPNPVPIQGRWDIHPLNLPESVLTKIYRDNARKLIPGL